MNPALRLMAENYETHVPLDVPSPEMEEVVPPKSDPVVVSHSAGQKEPTLDIVNFYRVTKATR